MADLHHIIIWLQLQGFLSFFLYEKTTYDISIFLHGSEVFRTNFFIWWCFLYVQVSFGNWGTKDTTNLQFWPEKARSHVRIIIYRTWPIANSDLSFFHSIIKNRTIGTLKYFSGDTQRCSIYLLVNWQYRFTLCGFGIKRWFWDTFSANLLLPLSTPKTKDVHRLIRWFPYDRQYFSWTSNISKRDIEYNEWCTIRILLLQLRKSRVWSHQCLSTRKISCSLNWFIYWSIYYTSMATNNTEML